MELDLFASSIYMNSTQEDELFQKIMSEVKDDSSLIVRLDFREAIEVF